MTENIAINLRSIDELFGEPAADPWDPETRYRSGIDEIWARLRMIPIAKPVSFTIHLPSTAISEDLETRTRQAFDRYCMAQIETNSNEIDTIKIAGRRDFVISIVATLGLLALIATIAAVLHLDGVLLSALIAWTGIAAWAILWGPVDTFIWGRLPYRREIRFYEKMLSSDLDVQPS